MWWWLATPVALTRAPIDDAAKLECVSYAPFRGAQTPHDSTLIVSPGQIAEDLAELAKVSKCIRTYSIDNGLDKVPELASRVGLKVLLGIWIGRDRAKNAHLVDIAVALVNDHPGTVAAVIVGSEVLLRGEMLVSDKIVLETMQANWPQLVEVVTDPDDPIGLKAGPLPHYVAAVIGAAFVVAFGWIVRSRRGAAAVGSH